MSLAAGAHLGPYEIQSLLGAGGMGEVWRAHDTRLERDVALKVLPAEALADETARARLVREARLASKLNHPHICTVYEVGESDGRTFIAMELVEGQPLSARLAEGLVPVEQVLRYGGQLADALAHAHSRGVVHRDFKSANVVVTPEDQVKVLDFGLAKRLTGEELADATTVSRQTLMAPGMVAGTLAYMAPEQLRGQAADARSDIWALGVVLYEMAARQRPFRGQNGFELTSAILKEPPSPLPAEVSAPLQVVVGRCLAKDPAERYQHADDVTVALRAVGREAQQPPGAVPQPLTPRPRIRRWFWPALGAGVLAAVAVFGALLWRAPRVHAPLASKVPEANEYFSRAMLFANTRQDLPRLRQMLEKALELDPRFAHARAWYGFTDAVLIDAGQSNDTSWLYKAEAELRRALEDDPHSARAHAALAFVYFYQGRKELMPQEAARAMELDPNEKEGPQLLAMYHQWNGEYERSQALFKSNLDIDPLFFPARVNVGENLRQMGNPSGSIREQQKVLEQDPQNIIAMLNLALAFQTLGDTTKARETIAEVRRLEPQNYALRLLWALQLAIEGQRADALQAMDAEVLKYGELISFASNVAEFYAVLEDRPKALEWLDRAVRVGDERADWFERDPLLANIRQEPRFREIVDGIRNRQEGRDPKAR